jgi:hypothetical protein
MNEWEIINTGNAPLVIDVKGKQGWNKLKYA